MNWLIKKCRILTWLSVLIAYMYVLIGAQRYSYKLDISRSWLSDVWYGGGSDKHKDKYRIGIVSVHNWPAEHNLARGLARIIQERGWEWYVMTTSCEQELQFPYSFVFKIVNSVLKPDFVLMLPALSHEDMDTPIYCAASVPDCKKNLLKRYNDCDAILSPMHLESFYEALPDNYRKQIYDIFYFTVPKTDFVRLDYKQLFYPSASWDYMRALHYRPLFWLLDKTSYFRTTGLCDYIPSSCKENPISPNSNYMISHIQDNGIALVLHSYEHLQGGFIQFSGRIFEAAAASAVIISDNNDFVRQEFGDSVLYVDHNADLKVMYSQIVRHVAWIHEHPNEAEAKARKAHQIFLDKFTLEGVLDRIIVLHTHLYHDGAKR